MNCNEFDLIADMISQAKDYAEYPAQQRFLRGLVEQFSNAFQNLFSNFERSRFLERVAMPEDFGHTFGRRIRIPIPHPAPAGQAGQAAVARDYRARPTPQWINPGAPTPAAPPAVAPDYRVMTPPQMSNPGGAPTQIQSSLLVNQMPQYEELVAEAMHIVARPRPSAPVSINRTLSEWTSTLPELEEIEEPHD